MMLILGGSWQVEIQSAREDEQSKISMLREKRLALEGASQALTALELE